MIEHGHISFMGLIQQAKPNNKIRDEPGTGFLSDVYVGTQLPLKHILTA